MSASSHEQASFDILHRVFSGHAAADIDGVPQEHLETVYAKACELIASEDFDAALDPLFDLVAGDPYDFRFQFGFGLCLHQLGRTEDAARHFGIAWMLDPSDAGCAFRLGECHSLLGNRAEAAEAFETAIALCDPPQLAPDIRFAAQAALDRLHG